jgi:hypothetical protein
VAVLGWAAPLLSNNKSHREVNVVLFIVGFIITPVGITYYGKPDRAGCLDCSLTSVPDYGSGTRRTGKVYINRSYGVSKIGDITLEHVAFGMDPASRWFYRFVLVIPKEKQPLL